ncbi:hypothetical protein OSH55_25315, partial [Mycobacterium ulcerans]
GTTHATDPAHAASPAITAVLPGCASRGGIRPLATDYAITAVPTGAAIAIQPAITAGTTGTPGRRGWTGGTVSTATAVTTSDGTEPIRPVGTDGGAGSTVGAHGADGF